MRTHTQPQRSYGTSRPILALLLILLLVAPPMNLGLQSGAAKTGAHAPASISASSTVKFATGSYPSALVWGPQSRYWFTLLGVNQLASYTPPATVVTTTVPATSTLRLFDLAIGPDQNLWFTEQLGNRLGRWQPGGAVTEFDLPGAGTYPSQIALGQDGALWFTEFEGDAIGRITADGSITEYPLPNPASKPLGIACDLQGNLWFTQWNGYRIGKISPSGDITQYSIPAASMPDATVPVVDAAAPGAPETLPAHPTEIVLGPDGQLWFVYEIGKKIVRIDPANGNMSAFTLATASSALFDLAIGPDGRLWFLGAQSVGAFDVLPGGPANVEETSIPAVFQGIGRSQIIAGPDGKMVFITANPHSPTGHEIWSAGPATPTHRDLQLFINKMPDYLLAKGEFEVAAQVTNWSADAASNLTLTLEIDEAVSYLGFSSPGLTCAPSAPTTVQCLAASLAGEASVPVTFTLYTESFSGETTQTFLSLKVAAAQSDYLPANNRVFRAPQVLKAFVYFNDFTNGADEHWSQQTTSEAGDRKYLGRFKNERVMLDFINIPPHDEMQLCFDLYILGSWDGSRLVDPNSTTLPPPVIGPDLWALYLDDRRQTVTTYSNQAGLPQAYPGLYPDAEHPARYAAAETGEFDGLSAVQDTRYLHCYRFPHSASTFTATFYGLNLDALSDESWALDNVLLKIYYHDVYTWLYLPAIVR